MGPRGSKTRHGWLGLCPVIAVLTHFGSHFGTPNSLFFRGNYLDYFLIIFIMTFGPILGPMLGADRRKKGARGAQEGHHEFARPKKLHFQIPSKTYSFSRFLGSRGLPREPQEAQEGSQEAPRELQNLKKRDSNFLTNFRAFLGSILGPKIAPKGYQNWDHFCNP